MNRDNIKTMIISAIVHLAPEVEPGEIDPDEDLRDECDLDSMDFLNLVAALKKSSGVSIPEADYPQVRTLNSMLNYLGKQLAD